MNVVARTGVAATLFWVLAAASLLVCAPAMAQVSSPSASQYADCSSGEAAEACTAASTYDGAEAFGENAQQGTGAVNEALEEPNSPVSAPASASAVGSREGDENGPASPDEGLASIKRLPETGGASPAALCSGVLLVVIGLLAPTLGWR